MKKNVKRTWAAAILCARSWIIGAELKETSSDK